VGTRQPVQKRASAAAEVNNRICCLEVVLELPEVEFGAGFGKPIL
jgi:hypothetical protein